MSNISPLSKSPFSSPSPVSEALDLGSPALWVSRFGLPIGGALLDSGRGEQSDDARFDALALTPSETLLVEETLDQPERDLYAELERWSARPWRDAVKREISSVAWAKLSETIELPIPLIMCALSYELGAERAGVSASTTAHPAPRLWAARYPAVYLWCRRRRRGFVVGESRRAVQALSEALSAPLREQRSSGEHPHARATHNPWLTQGQSLIQGELRPHMGWPAYRAALAEVRELLLSGDLYQLNFTLGMSAKLEADVSIEEVFTRLHAVNSGPFGALINIDERRSVLSFSPERLVQWSGVSSTKSERVIKTSPIKGTRPRSADPQRDQAAREELRASEKDQAEHVMILDLERNDLGRICESGSVEVAVDRALCSYSTVHHLVSVVQGQLRPEASLTDILEATFPGGSVTGAPKRRAMQAIRSLEVGPRGVYCGALGYLDPMGGGDLNLPIRTALIDGDRFTYHAGGGIVVDSTARGEWDEVWVKTQGVLKGLGVKE